MWIMYSKTKRLGPDDVVQYLFTWVTHQAKFQGRSHGPAHCTTINWLPTLDWVDIF